MARGTWLIDTSAYVRLARRVVVDQHLWHERIGRGLVRLLAVTRLEIGLNARNGAMRQSLFEVPPLSLMPVEFLTPEIEKRADEVQTLLADRGQHRGGPGLHDLLVAAAAEKLRLTVVHDDSDFETIAEITGQTTERISVTDR